MTLLSQHTVHCQCFESESPPPLFSMCIAQETVFMATVPNSTAWKNL